MTSPRDHDEDDAARRQFAELAWGPRGRSSGPREPRVLSEPELVEIEKFLARDWPPEVIGDYPEEIITQQANFAPDLVFTIRELQRQHKAPPATPEGAKP